ncbi:MAG: polysaccharide biosynthesis tyrosine autokinase [Myxococcota bacterium]
MQLASPPNSGPRNSVSFEPGPEPDGGLDLRQVLQLIVRRRWIIVGAIAVAVFLGIVLTIRAPRIYLASSKVLIELNTPNYLDDEVREVYDPGAYGYLGLQQFYKTQFDIIQGQPVAERVVAMLGIDGQTLTERLQAAGAVDGGQGKAGDVLGGLPPDLQEKLRLIGISKPESREEIIEALEGFDAVEFAQGKVEVSSSEDSRIVEIEVRDTAPERAALLANAVTDAYVEYNLDLRTSTARSAADWLSGQLADLKQKLADAELALYTFKKENNIVSVSLEDRQSMISQTLTELNSRLSEVRAERIALESLREQVDRTRANQELRADSLESVASSPVVQNLKQVIAELKRDEAQLSTRYTDRHPRLLEAKSKVAALEAALNDEIESLLQAAEQRYRAAKETEDRLRVAIEKTKTEALDINKREIQYTRLQREANNYSSLYNLVLKRQKETDLTTLLNVNNVQRFEAAKAPKRPVSPRPLANVFVSLVLGVLLGAGLAFAVDMLDNTVKSQTQIEEAVGVPFLGIVPMIKTGRGSRDGDDPSVRDLYILDNQRSAVAECTRTIRTNLMFMSPEDPARLLMVTSSSPREGKSTIAINLSIVTAQSGKKTLIVDTDMRRPRLHNSFSRSNDVGLSNYIVGEATVDQAIQPSGIDRLDLLTCGPIPPNPAELLHTEAFASLLTELSERYDRVIFDTPPVTAVTDALVLASMMDGVVLVVHVNLTTVPSAQLARRRVEDVGGRIFGAVLNDVDLDDRRASQYYQQYYYYYRNPYVAENTPNKKASG